MAWQLYKNTKKRKENRKEGIEERRKHAGDRCQGENTDAINSKNVCLCKTYITNALTQGKIRS